METDTIAFEALYRDYYPRVRRYLARLVSFEEAEDVAQDVFLKISRSLHTFRGESSLSTWIYRIATNAAMDYVRSPAGRARCASSTAADPADDEAAAQLHGAASPVEHDAIRGEMSACVQSLVAQLPENYRAVLVLAETEGLKNSEIAEVLGLSLETVKIRLHRARARLKQLLESSCTFYHDPCNTLLCESKRACG
jgi:RNA polymerase sigma-70 factor (ECF subfamily)